ncbi:18464_t:CDS:2 [Gigaspora rosea]|nr:18464_t:CDS:2 [Gigaspora rosea]
MLEESRKSPSKNTPKDGNFGTIQETEAFYTMTLMTNFLTGPEETPADAKSLNENSPIHKRNKAGTEKSYSSSWLTSYGGKYSGQDDEEIRLRDLDSKKKLIIPLLKWKILPPPEIKPGRIPALTIEWAQPFDKHIDWETYDSV